MSTLSKTLDARLSVNDILRHHPAAVSVLSAYRIACCCRGEQSPATAASELGLDPAHIVEAITGDAIADAELPGHCSCGHVYTNESSD